jgi:hypothetical protein
MTIKSNTEYDCTHQQREDHLIRAKLFHPSALLIPQSLPCGILPRRAAFGSPDEIGAAFHWASIPQGGSAIRNS